MAGDTVALRVRDEALQVARGWSGVDALPSWRLTASLYGVLGRDDELLQLAALIPAERLPPLLFVASVQRLVMRHREHPFSAYFPVPGGDQPPLDDRFPDLYRSFCLEHRAELEEIRGRRRYQMNEVARCTQISLGLGVLARALPGREMALVDVGTGSGLGLYPDRYRYRLSDDRKWGPTGSPVEAFCELQGHLRPVLPAGVSIMHRVGIDPDPVDLGDPEERAWLEACAPPEAAALDRLDHAIGVMASERARVLRGTAGELLGDVLAEIPAGLMVAVVDSYTAVFFEEGELARLARAVESVGARRDVAWIALDPLVPLGTRARRTVQGIDPGSRLIARNRRGGVFAALSLIARSGQTASSRLLAAAHPSGTRMEWLDPDSAL